MSHMSFQQKLLEWFAKYQRPLPWRKRYEPYEVWVSEIMLQQTQMDTVLPYFERWMKNFPDIKSLAKANSEKVLKLWEGLGYYSRARNLHESAKIILKEYGGIFPSDYENILKIKGIGRYTAGAVASIAFNQDKPIVDGNVLRVLSRVYAIPDPIDVQKNKETFWTLQESLIPKGKAREFNQGLMELGALICASQNPSCAICPLRALCKAYAKGEAENYPVKIQKKQMVKVQAAALVLENEGKYLIRRRPIGEIMGGLWEFPEWKLSKDKKMSLEQIQKKLKQAAGEEFDGKFEKIQPLGTIKRNYTHHLETLHVFHHPGPVSIRPKTGWQSQWVSKKDFKKYPFSSAHAKIIKLLEPELSAVFAEAE